VSTQPGFQSQTNAILTDGSSTTTSDEDAELAEYLAAHPDQGHLRAQIQMEQQRSDYERHSHSMCYQQAQQHANNWHGQTNLLQHLRHEQLVLQEAIRMLHHHEPEIKAEMVAEMDDLARREREAQRMADGEKQAYHRLEAGQTVHARNEMQSLVNQFRLEAHLREMQARGR
jgi:hypothetical protein